MKCNVNEIFVYSYIRTFARLNDKFNLDLKTSKETIQICVIIFFSRYKIEDHARTYVNTCIFVYVRTYVYK